MRDVPFLDHPIVGDAVVHWNVTEHPNSIG
jgi:hypothetical protein